MSVSFWTGAGYVVGGVFLILPFIEDFLSWRERVRRDRIWNDPEEVARREAEHEASMRRACEEARQRREEQEAKDRESLETILRGFLDSGMSRDEAVEALIRVDVEILRLRMIRDGHIPMLMDIQAGMHPDVVKAKYPDITV